MALILCEAGDESAAWAAARLAERGAPADLLFNEALGRAARWEHRVDAASASVKVTLADGRILSSDAPVPILNRLSFAPLGAMRAAAGPDFGYAVQETFAFYLSWLHAWPGTVINRPAPQGLSGYYRHASQWMTMGAQAGFDVRPWTQSSDDAPEIGWAPRPAEATAFVVGDRLVLPPTLPAMLGPPCARLAALAGNALLGVDFARGEAGGWTMVGASPIPNLFLGGEPLIEALTEALAP
jgi:hypothetical protein